MKTKVHFMLWVALATLLAACSGKEATKEQMLDIRTTQATLLAAQGTKEFPFIAQPRRTSQLSFRVGGPISHFDLYAGNRYIQGQVMAEIDPRDFRIRCEQTEAIYHQAKAEFERIATLYAKENISASTYEKAKADCVTAKTAYETAANELHDTRLTAPFNGYISEVYIEKYQDVKPAQQVLSLIAIDQLKIEVYITHNIARHTTQVGDSIRLCFDDLPGREFQAKIAEISKGTSQNNLSYLLTAFVSNNDGELLAGMSGKALLNLPTTEGPSGVCIPQTALAHRPTQGNYVWVVDVPSSTVSQRKVTVKELLPNGKASISDGIKPKEVIATSSLRFLSDGMKITINK